MFLLIFGLVLCGPSENSAHAVRRLSDDLRGCLIKFYGLESVRADFRVRSEPPNSLEPRVQWYRKWIDRIVTEGRPGQALWTHRCGRCAPYSQQITEALAAVGLGELSNRKVVSHFSSIRIGQEFYDILFYHYFYADVSEGPNKTVIVDPTYLQFVDSQIAADLPPLFVGTRDDLVRLFSGWKSALVLPFFGVQPASTADIDIETWVDANWGFNGYLKQRKIGVVDP